MSLADKCYCPKCARKMAAQRMGKDLEGKPHFAYYCISCDPIRSGSQESYEVPMGIMPQRRKRRRRW